MKHLPCVLPLLLLFASCSKKQECSFHYQHLPAPIDIIGFTPAEVQTIYVRVYKANTNFDLVERQDTIDTRSLIMRHDTLLFYSISIGKDYLVTVPATGNQFRITEVFDPNEDYSWTTTESCPHGNFGQSMPNRAAINGDHVSASAKMEASLPFPVYTFHLSQ